MKARSAAIRDFVPHFPALHADWRLRLAPCPEALYTSRRFPNARALRLAVQDVALSRRKHGFDSRRARQKRSVVYAQRTKSHRASREPQRHRCLPCRQSDDVPGGGAELNELPTL